MFTGNHAGDFAGGGGGRRGAGGGRRAAGGGRRAAEHFGSQKLWLPRSATVASLDKLPMSKLGWRRNFLFVLREGLLTS